MSLVNVRRKTHVNVLQVRAQPPVEGERPERRLHIGALRVLSAGAEVDGQHRLLGHGLHTNLIGSYEYWQLMNRVLSRRYELLIAAVL